MEDFSEMNFNSLQDKMDALAGQMENLRAYVDQKFDELSSSIDELESRINNLR
jgi:outer membrane murein-binding lipoprotein Lpp